MKKCPYCAEEIQDEAVVCKHCGRDLMPKEKPVQKSVWRSSRTAAIVISVIYVINTVLTAPNDAEMIGGLTVGLLVTFFVWWAICAFIVWVWRKIRS